MISARLPEFQMNSYENLLSWLKEDISDNAVSMETLSKKITALSKKLHEMDTELVSRYANSIEKIKGLETSIKGNRINLTEANQALAKIFIDSFFSKPYFLKRKTDLLQSDIDLLIRERIQYPNPLPSLDFMFTLASDTRKLTQLERAAIMIHCLVGLKEDLQANKGDFLSDMFKNINHAGFKYLFGATVSPKENHNALLLNKHANYVAILIEGQCYKIDVACKTRPICVDTLYTSLLKTLELHKKIIQEGEYHHPIGSLTSSDPKLSHQTRKKLEAKDKINRDGFHLLDNALFVVSLDSNHTENKDSKLKKFYIKNYGNRWYGTTQLIINASNDTAVIVSYSKGAALNIMAVADELYKRSIQTKKPTQQTALLHSLTTRINFNILSKEVSSLEQGTEEMIINQPTVFDINFGTEYFKEVGLSPNISMHIILILAIYDLLEKRYMPVTNQALDLALYNNEAIQTDWVFTMVAPLKEFVLHYESGGKSKSTLFQEIKKIIATHKKKLLLARTGLSPTFLINKSNDAYYRILGQFFFALGKENAAYRNYMFRSQRIPESIDVMSSSFKLPSSVEFVSRPGCLLDIFSITGVHILMHAHNTTLCFMPKNIAWANRLPQLSNNMEKWAEIIKDLGAPTGSLNNVQSTRHAS